MRACVPVLDAAIVKEPRSSPLTNDSTICKPSPSVGGGMAIPTPSSPTVISTM